MKMYIKKVELRIVAYLVLLMIVFGSTGCSIRPMVQAPPTLSIPTGVVETLRVTTTNPPETTMTLTSIPTPTIEPVSSKRTVYQFIADLDYNKHSLLVRQTIHYQNSTGQELPELKLMVPPNEKTNVFSLNSIVVSGDASLAEFALDGVILNLTFSSALPVDGSIDIIMDYLIAPKLQGGVLGYTAKRINFSDWYPFIPPYDSEGGWIIHQPAVVGEYLVYDVADFDLTLNLVDGSGLVVAGSTEVAPLELNKYNLQSKNRRNLTFSVSDQYSVITNTTNGITVKGYIFEGDEVSGQAAVNYTATALQLYGELFGIPYPHQTISLVESDFPDGMEYDGLYYLSDFYFKNYDDTFMNYLALLSVHETAHQWWFGIVGNDQALEPWLDESLATYSEYLYIERYYPDLINWWWDYRINYYQPSGHMNMTIYDQSNLRVYINAVYFQGAKFIHQLREILGDDLFFSGVINYCTIYQNQIAYWDDFIRSMVENPDDATKELEQQFMHNP